MKFNARATALLTALIGFVASIFFALKFPAVESLGAKVRLPVFHGALTWATLMLFGGLIVVAALYLIKRSDRIFAWSSALRYTIVLLWTAGTVLGFMAAMSTWDFTGSKTPVMTLLMSDPRLVVQLVVTCAALAMLILPIVLESDRGMAFADLIFAVGTLGGLAWAMGAGKALHPDSPVMNSDEIFIKVIFFCIVISHMVGALGLTSFFAIWRQQSAKKAVAE